MPITVFHIPFHTKSSSGNLFETATGFGGLILSEESVIQQPTAHANDVIASMI
jgi:hypothetical protein